VGISRDFSNAKEIEPLYVAQFCWSRYIDEHDAEKLEPDHEGSYLRLFPRETVRDYAKRYFDLDELDVSHIDEGSFDPQRKAFLFSPGGKRQPPRPSYTGSFRGKRLEKAERNSDGTITAILVEPDSQRYDRIEYTDSFTLKERQDGSLYFTSGKRKYINNHLVSITGDYKHFDKITGFDGRLDALSMLGEKDGRLIFAYTPYEKGKAAAVMLLNPESMTVEKWLDINGEFEATDVSLKGERILIRLSDRVVFVDKTLEGSEENTLPNIITEKINREPKYNENNNPMVFFGGYDVSNDRTKYVYSDEIGLKLYNTADSSERLLSKTVPITNSELLDNSFHWEPRFVDNDSKVITTMTGYEGGLGYSLYDFKSETQETLHMGMYSSTGFIRYDTGLLEINNYIRDEENQTGDYKTLYLDFKTGQVQEISLEDPGDTGYIVMPDQLYVGENFAAFITSKYDRSDHANNVNYINRLNLTTLQLEPKIITAKAAETHILGVLADGRTLFWYNLNPSENGVCITNRKLILNDKETT